MSKIEIGGKQRDFSLDLYTFRVAERRHNVRIKASDFGDMGMGDLALYLWIGLLADDPTLSEDKVLGWIRNVEPKTQQSWLEMVVDAVGSFGQLGEEVAEAENPPMAEENGLSTGKKSALSPTES